MRLLFMAALIVLPACASTPTDGEAEKYKYRATRLNAQYEPTPPKIEPYTPMFTFNTDTEFFSQMVKVGSKAARQCEAYARLSIPGEPWLRPCEQALAEGDLSGFNRAATLYNRGLIQMKLGKSEAAKASFQAALEQEPEFAAGYFGQAMIASNRSEFDSAIFLAEKAIQMDLENAHEAYYLIGYVRERQFEFDKARTAYRRALEISPGASDARLNLERVNRLWPAKPARNFATEI